MYFSWFWRTNLVPGKSSFSGLYMVLLPPGCVLTWQRERRGGQKGKGRGEGNRKRERASVLVSLLIRGLIPIMVGLGSTLMNSSPPDYLSHQIYPFLPPLCLDRLSSPWDPYFLPYFLVFILVADVKFRTHRTLVPWKLRYLRGESPQFTPRKRGPRRRNGSRRCSWLLAEPGLESRIPRPQFGFLFKNTSLQ